METLASSCYDIGMGRGFFDQWELSALDELGLVQDLERSPSAESYSSNPAEAGGERPKKLAQTSSWSSCTTTDHSVKILSFGNPESPICHRPLFGGALLPVEPKEEADALTPNASKRSYDAMLLQGSRRASMGSSRTTSNKQEHILAERKRREKLSQRFIALFAMLPDLKKMDKASVLGDAIKYLKQLQEKVNSLEDQATKRSIESAVLVKKSRLCADDDCSTLDESLNGSQCGESLPEIEARVCEKSILIKIHCENQKGMLVKALSEIEKLHLSVMNTSVIPFAASSLDITVMTQMEEDCSITAKDVVKKLNSAFRVQSM